MTLRDHVRWYVDTAGVALDVPQSRALWALVLLLVNDDQSRPSDTGAPTWLQILAVDCATYFIEQDPLPLARAA